MALTLPLHTPATIPVVKAVAAKTVTVSALTVEYYREEPKLRRLVVKFAEIPYPIIVFAGTDYDAIEAIWTDQDVANKIALMFPAQ
jgi:hypothetical protein